MSITYYYTIIRLFNFQKGKKKKYLKLKKIGPKTETYFLIFLLKQLFDYLCSGAAAGCAASAGAASAGAAGCPSVAGA